MKVLLWHVHGGWTDAFVHGRHEYLLPTTPARDGWGLGRGGRDWPAREVAPEAIRAEDVDVVVLQRPEELAEAERLTGRRIGADLPAVYLEHNTPKGDVPTSVHPMADRSDLDLVHVTHTNALLWDTGSTRARVVEHGVRDPGLRYTGALERLAAVINEPVRRWRVTGTDLLPRFAAEAPVDVFGMRTELLAGAFEGSPAIHAAGDLPPQRMHPALAERRAYLHPHRWTSLGLSLIEAMQLGMPVIALAATEAPRAVPPEAGAISADVAELVREARRLLDDPDEAVRRGRVAREVALARYGLDRFLADWDDVLDEAVARRSRFRQTPPGGLAPPGGAVQQGV
ncbi:glycosyltransferase [Amnibacterium kyonggiense]|uniref:Glycosyl transferase family 1 n=1 Tax=Amnibacterium kyonggiense TaxID=595671 RepID=A0A4R7FIK6_9MICO|nr:glycosyltransferase [Amnibacterium kyonggiense]TDS76041.1 glycosyl transferase family 1 [Amnibacterium kyonggiense]